MAHLFPNLLLLGYPDRARARRAEAIKLMRRAGHPLTLAANLHWVVLSAFLLRERAALREWVDEFVERISREQQDRDAA